jgi:stearoyl-CoA desaturase (Delta-9 desaturase)
VASGVFSSAEGWWARRDRLTECVFWAMHASCLLVFWVGVSTSDLVLLAATFYARMFGITGGYHRYFSHKTYKTSRAFQFGLAVLGATATQKGVLWWAGHHRIHHKYADQPDKDVHSPRDGFWHSHQGWIFHGRWDG